MNDAESETEDRVVLSRIEYQIQDTPGVGEQTIYLISGSQNRVIPT